MELSNRIAEVFKQYYDILDDIIWTKRQEDELTNLQNKANALINELKMFGQSLAELEDKIENGTLIELPCKKGDDVFAIVSTTAYDNSIITGTVEGLAYIILDEYGDITFQDISRVSPIKTKQN